ncbi:uncharacterized protein BXIN_1528 [Babesia sp. Xinjiang]|uniref:uncharacterized protein n=1 Tax=Babesia sp. Xinjiang TaxID=462227 RepID=UPI000A266AF0|nr:uncharacterized protein BXIN_1528 [Babesia sp. Xinjiang]ORM42184.1 hypothetical protein BXIN_1528 [Babesia sp. Xinjiang]
MVYTVDRRIFAIYGVLPHVNIKDVYIVAGAAALLLTLRFIVAGVNNGSKSKCPSLFTFIIDKLNIAKEGKSYKLAESLWYLCWHTTSLACTIAVFCDEYGTPDNHKWLYHFMNDLKGIWFFTESYEDVVRKTITWPDLIMSPKAKILTLVSIGFWISCCVYIHWETRRSDMRIMRFHHFTTVALLIINYVYSFHRIGLVCSKVL